MGITNTWIAAGPGDWSDDANWSLGHSPIAGEDPTFDDTSVNNCNADDPTPTGALTIAAGYTGTITQSSDMYISGYYQAGGTFTGNPTKWVYIQENMIKTGGTFTSLKTRLIISESYILNLSGFHDQYFHSIINNGTLNVLNGVIYIPFLNENNGIINIYGNSKYRAGYETNKLLTYHNYGMINSYETASMEIWVSNMMPNYQLILGNNNCNLVISSRSTSRNVTITPLGNISNLGMTKITSNDPTYTCTLDLNGHNLTCSSLTIDTRGILQCGEGTIRTNSLDSSAGTIIPETACWVFDGAATVNVAAGQKLHSVIVKDRLKLLSNLGIEQALAHTNPLDLNGFALTLDRPDNEYTSIRRPMVRAIRKLDLGPMGALDRWMTDLGGVV